MNHFQMFLSDRRLAFERVVSRSPDPDSVFADAGNGRVVYQAAKTLDKPDGPAAAQCHHGAISMLNCLAIMLGQCHKGWTVDR